MALSKTTQDHDEIRQWAEKRGGKPAEVASTSQGGTGILRIEFPGAPRANDSNLEEISWDEFFEKFDASGLSLVYQEVTSEGAESNFNKLVHPENVSQSARGTRKTAGRKSASAAKKTTGKKAASAKKTAGKKAVPAKKTAAGKTTKAAARGAAKKVPAKKAATGTRRSSCSDTMHPRRRECAIAHRGCGGGVQVCGSISCLRAKPSPQLSGETPRSSP